MLRFDQALHTSYAQAKESALAQATIPLMTPGSVQVKNFGGRSSYVYRVRYDLAGKQVAEYLGPEGATETNEKIRAAEAEIREGGLLAKATHTLRRVGFYVADKDTTATVARLAAAGIFRGGVLVGSHAFGAIMNDLGYRLSALRTDDVDVARAGRIELAALPKGGFLAMLKETGLPFHEVPGLDRKAPATSFKVRGQHLSVDLLVPAKGKPYQPVAVPELGAHATSLPFLDYLLADPQTSVLLGRGRIVPIVVPHAGRYALHKLAVHAMRAPASKAKRDKDLDQATTLIETLAGDADEFLDEAAAAMSKALRTKARAGAKRVLTALQGNAAAARVLEQIAF